MSSDKPIQSSGNRSNNDWQKIQIIVFIDFFGADGLCPALTDAAYRNTGAATTPFRTMRTRARRKLQRAERSVTVRALARNPVQDRTWKHF